MTASEVLGRYVTCPTRYQADVRRTSIFLAGGITGCPDWQAQIAETPLCRQYRVDLLNPRRTTFDVNNAAATVEQIKWEYDHLAAADAILFWFCADTIQPIALLELGAWSRSSKPLFVGVNPLYSRKVDVIEQLKLARPDVRVCLDGLAALTWQVEHWLSQERLGRS